MKKTVFILMLFYGVLASAQLTDNSLNAIDVSAGYAENGFGVSLSYNRYISYSKRNNYFQFALLYTFSNIEKKGFDLPYNLITLNLGYFYNIPLDRFDKINLNLGGGMVAGIERINKGNKELETGALLKSDGGFIYGPFIGGELELFVSSNVSFLIKANEFYHINSDIGDFTIFAGGGIRVFL
ncbi:conjugal transfer protein TraO [Aquimarina mytili]|uniref:Conjugal transfer protein TraO n=1 Tax=Aquimarina mytili TaxID=874423 RepID=A0A936ZVC6_9FLAO|nr:conjugal transfer protein TraO [Aquimarina mytili]MBL0686072.1 conjugal transfer protein TraO [Aquimarina mytili]